MDILPLRPPLLSTLTLVSQHSQSEAQSFQQEEVNSEMDMEL